MAYAYGCAREDRLTQQWSVSEAGFCIERCTFKCAPLSHQHRHEKCNPRKIRRLHFPKFVAAEGLEPSLAEKQKTASSEQNSAKSQQINALEGEGEA